MNSEDLNLYEQQLVHVNQALLSCVEGPEKQELLTLKASIEELLQLSKDEDATNSNGNEMDDEFAAFMAEMEKEGAVEKNNSINNPVNVKIESKDIEGKKCRAPHEHQWGHIAYHNAMICSIVSNENEELKVRILFTNPTHQEMLPCPFYYNSDCKFSEEQCKFSHGEIVLYSSLQDYVEPNFELLTKGSSVLAKQKNNLWYRAKVQHIYENKCLVKYESDRKELEVPLEHVFPLEKNSDESSDNDEDLDNLDIINYEDIINTSLLVTPTNQVMGDWEKYTKGMGSKLMFKMGYIVGTGLGKKAEGIVNPVSAVIFPPGKSLDHCMKLREQSGGDKDLFSVERKMKRLQRKQEIQSKKAYEKEQQRQDVFTFINKTMQGSEEKNNKLNDRQDIKTESSRSLNIKSVTVEEDIKKTERDLEILRSSLSRHTNETSDVYKKLKEQFIQRQRDLEQFQNQARLIRNEQSLRDNKKKLTIF